MAVIKHPTEGRTKEVVFPSSIQFEKTAENFTRYISLGIKVW